MVAFDPVSRILIVAAHPDDEVLGCGGTIARHAAQGADVATLFLADGETSRDGTEPSSSSPGHQVVLRQEAAAKAAIVLGTQPPTFAGLRDNRLDSYDLLEIVQIIEKQIEAFRPEVIFTHFGNDLNIDHSIAYRATMTACRPLPKTHVRSIVTFEVPSSTEWAPTTSGKPFLPSMFVDVSTSWDTKISALRCYDREMHPFPHSRSYEAVKALALWRGGSVGLSAAEAFQIERTLV